MPWPVGTTGNGRTDPYTPDELLDMRKAGEPVSTIMQRARRLNGWDRARVREILFGETVNG